MDNFENDQKSERNIFAEPLNTKIWEEISHRNSGLIQGSKKPERQKDDLTFTDLGKERGITPDESMNTAKARETIHPHLAVEKSTLPHISADGALLGLATESAAVGIWSGRVDSIRSGEKFTTFRVSDALHSGFRGVVGAIGVGLVETELSRRYQSDLLKPSVPESLAMGAAFGISDGRMRVAAIAGAWLLGRIYNYTEQKLANFWKCSTIKN